MLKFTPPPEIMGKTHQALMRRRKPGQAPRDNRGAGLDSKTNCGGIPEGQCPHKQQADGPCSLQCKRHKFFQGILKTIDRRSDGDILLGNKQGGDLVNPYKENGYKDRADYLEQLADEYAAPMEVVMALADTLGPDEDFDGLVSGLRDWEDWQAHEDMQ